MLFSSIDEHRDGFYRFIRKYCHKKRKYSVVWQDNKGIQLGDTEYYHTAMDAITAIAESCEKDSRKECTPIYKKLR